MSITIKGSIPEKIFNKYQGKSRGSQGVAETVSIDIPNLQTNRRPNCTKLAKYIDRNGGFDWALFGMPIVARYPNGRMEIIDGGHRVTMLQLFLPDVTTFTACVVDVEDEARGKELFHNFNGTSSSTVSNECRFVNEVQANENVPLNKRIVRVLEATGVTVYEHDECYVTSSVTNPNWKINFKAIEWMVKKDIPTAIQSLVLYTSVFKTKGSTPNSVVNQLAKALQQLFISYRQYFENEANVAKFAEWFEKKAESTTAQNMLYKHYSHDRMEQRHLGTAYGLMQDFRSTVENDPKKGGITVPEMAPIKNLYKKTIVV